MNKLFLVSGHSGGGKTTIMRSLMDNEIISFTTREKRVGEVDGVDYKYITEDEFFSLKSSGGIIEWTQYSNNYYGIDEGELKDKLSKGNAFCIVDFNGVKQFKEFYPNITTIFIYTDFDVALKQMLQRGDIKDKISQRLHTYKDELNNRGKYDYVIKNNHGQLHNTKKIIESIIESELNV